VAAPSRGGAAQHQESSTRHHQHVRISVSAVEQKAQIFFAVILKRKSFDFYEFYKFLAHVFLQKKS
jgi:hypothetical protein